MESIRLCGGDVTHGGLDWAGYAHGEFDDLIGEEAVVVIAELEVCPALGKVAMRAAVNGE
jgi:hypothetical protein